MNSHFFCLTGVLLFKVVFVDKGSVKNPDRFERMVDAQSSLDCNFQLVGSAVFGRFISKLINQV